MACEPSCGELAVDPAENGDNHLQKTNRACCRRDRAAKLRARPALVFGTTLERGAFFP